MGGAGEKGLAETIVSDAKDKVKVEDDPHFPDILEDKTTVLERITGPCRVKAIEGGDSRDFAAFTFWEDFLAMNKSEARIKHRIVFPQKLAEKLRLNDSVELWIRRAK